MLVFVGSKKNSHLCTALTEMYSRGEFGRMAEWSNAAVLKTVDLHGSGGSNPSSSAKAGAVLRLFFVFIIFVEHIFIYGQKQGY